MKPAKPKTEVNVSPNAAALAEQLKVDVAKVTGSGFEGRITVADVEKYASRGDRS